MAVVDEDGGLLGLGVDRGGEAADVPAVAHGEEGQQGDEGVLHGVDGAGQPHQVCLGGEQLGRDGEPHGFGDELLGGEVELLGAQDLVAARPLLLEGDHPGGDGDLPQVEGERAVGGLQALAEDAGVGLAPGQGVVGVPERPDEGHVAFQVERGDQVGVAHVQVDRAGMQGGEGGLGSLGADDVARLFFDDGVLLAGGGAQADLGRGEVRRRRRTRRRSCGARRPSSAACSSAAGSPGPKNRLIVGRQGAFVGRGGQMVEVDEGVGEVDGGRLHLAVRAARRGA